MKILSVNKFFYINGGSETYYFSLQNILQKNGHEVVPFAMADENNFDTPYAKYFVNNIDYSSKSLTKKIRNGFKIIYSAEAKKKISALLDKVKPDIVHLHIFQHQISPSILPEIKKRGIPIVYTVHDYKPVCPNYKMMSKQAICEKCKGGLYFNCLLNKCTKNSYSASLINTIEMYFHRLRRYYNLIDVFITPSKFLKQKLIEFGIAENRVTHIPNFVDVNNFEVVAANGNAPYFVYFGRLSEEKGILTLIQAMKKVRGGQLYLIGTGPLEQKIRSVIDTSGLSNIKILGFMQGDDLKNIIKNSLFTVLPSEWYENNPLALLEACAYSKATIGSNIGGIPEIINNNINGLLFEPKNPDDLAQKINFLLNNKGKSKMMGANARSLVKDNNNPHKHYESIMSIYERLLSEKSAVID